MNPLRIALLGSPCATRAAVASRWRGAVAADGCADDIDAVLIHDNADDSLFENGISLAINRGCHLLIEDAGKLSAVEFRGIQSQLQAIGRRLLWTWPARWELQTREILQAVNSKRLGRPGLVRMHDWRPQNSVSIPCPLPRDHAVRSTNRPLRGLLIGGWDVVSQIFAAVPEVVFVSNGAVNSQTDDSTNPIIERRLNRTSNDISTTEQTQLLYNSSTNSQSSSIAPHTKDTQVAMHLGFADGGMAIISFSWGLPAGDRYHSLSVIAASGAAYADDHHNRQLVFSGGNPRAPATNSSLLPLLNRQQWLIDSIRSAEPSSHPSSIEFNQNQLAWAAINESWRTGKSIETRDIERNRVE